MRLLPLPGILLLVLATGCTGGGKALPDNTLQAEPAATPAPAEPPSTVEAPATVVSQPAPQPMAETPPAAEPPPAVAEAIAPIPAAPEQKEPVAAGEPPAPAEEPEAVIPATPPPTPPAAPNVMVNEPAVPEPAPVAPPPTPPVATNVAVNEPAVSEPAPVAPPPAPAKPAASPPPAAKPPVPTLDVNSLKERLKETKAIGVFTKLALKNQVDDLLKQFQAYYQARQKSDISPLRQAYNMLVLKVLSLIQDGDPNLAHIISASREAIWNMLADPVKFNSLII